MGVITELKPNQHFSGILKFTHKSLQNVTTVNKTEAKLSSADESENRDYKSSIYQFRFQRKLRCSCNLETQFKILQVFRLERIC